MAKVTFPQGHIVSVAAGKKIPKDVEVVVTGLFADDATKTKKRDEITSALVAVGHAGKWGRTRTVATKEHLVVGVGLGKRAEFTQDKLRQAAAIGAKHLGDATRAATTLATIPVEASAEVSNAAAVAEGFILGSYSFDGLKTCLLYTSDAADE